MRSMIRVLTTATVVLALLVLTVPVAHTRPLDQGTERVSAVHQGASWFQAVLALIARFLPDGDQPRKDGTLLPHTMQPLTGSCIDPQGGGPRCGGI
jgi:hypothetical protein